MTVEEIDQLQAGRELDIMIAERLMGQIWRGGNPIAGYEGKWPWPYPYSTDIKAAWEMVEKMNPVHPLILTFRPTEKDWWVMLPDESRHPKGQRGHGPNCFVQAFADTAPLAICRAALKTMEVKSNERI